MLHSKALLGLVVQVRGKEYVQKNLEFDIYLRLGDLERRYKGSWPGDASPGAHAKTTDWWINLEMLFPRAEIKQICRSGGTLNVELGGYRFIDK
jgi:hypothetical protein